MHGPLRDDTGEACQPLVSVVVPVFNEEEVLPELHERLRTALASVEGGYEIVYVDDGSADRSAQIDRGLGAGARTTSCSCSCRATSAWRSRCRPGSTTRAATRTVLMHADLQDPPELIPDMLAAGAEEEADVVFARRIGRDESRAEARCWPRASTR